MTIPKYRNKIYLQASNKTTKERTKHMTENNIKQQTDKQQAEDI